MECVVAHRRMEPLFDGAVKVFADQRHWKEISDAVEADGEIEETVTWMQGFQ